MRIRATHTPAEAASTRIVVTLFPKLIPSQDLGVMCRSTGRKKKQSGSIYFS